MNSNKLKILFIPLITAGCINPCIGIAEMLYRRGHRIIFVINKTMKGKFNYYGFEECEIIEKEGMEMGMEMFLNKLFEWGFYDSTKSPLEKMKLIGKDMPSVMVDVSKDISLKVKDILERIEPNIIITNSFFTAIPSVMKSGIPWVSVVSSNPLRFIEDDRTPPSYSGLPLYDQTEWTHFREEYDRLIQPVIEQLNQWMIKEELSPQNRLHYESPFLNIYNIPIELDYIHVRPLPLQWIRCDAFMRTENGTFEIPENFKSKTGKLIYFTMGSQLSVNVPMMLRLIQLLQQTPHRYVVSKGPFADRYELPDNMCGDRMIPQTKILPLIDMVIFHGGHNTLVEAFYFGKPMIIMPLGNDAYDNAQRVVEEGFGVKLDPMTCTKEELSNAIDNILENEDLAKRFEVISKRIQNEVKSDRIAKIIEELQ